jgi:fucose permease
MNQKYIITTAYYLAFILLGITISAEGNTLLKLAEYTSSAIAAISWIFFFGSLGYLAGSYISGKLFDRIDGHRLLGTALALAGAVSIFVPLARTLWVLILILFVLGFFKGVMDVGCNTLLIWLHKEQVNPFMNGLHAFFGVGAFLSPLLIAWILSTTGEIYWAYWIFSAAALPIALLIWFLPSPQPRTVPDHHKDLPFPIAPVALMVTCFILYVGMEVGYGNWIYTYAVKLKLATEITAYSIASAFWGSFTIGRLAGIWISTRLRSLTILIIDFVGCLISAFLIMVFPASPTMLWIGSILLGISLASIFPTLLALAEERVHITGTITGLFLVGGSLGSMVIPVLIGQAFDRVGATSMIWIVFASIVLNVVALFGFIKTPLNTPILAGDKSPLET